MCRYLQICTDMYRYAHMKCFCLTCVWIVRLYSVYIQVIVWIIKAYVSTCFVRGSPDQVLAQHRLGLCRSKGSQGRYLGWIYICGYNIDMTWYDMIWCDMIWCVCVSVCLLCVYTIMYVQILVGGFINMFYFPYIGHNNSNWLSYFEGLKQPTRYTLW